MNEKPKFNSLQQVLDYTLRHHNDLENQANEFDNQEKENNFRISDMGRCQRMRILKFRDYDFDKFEDRTLRIFGIGKMNHEYLQNIFKENGLLVSKEKQVIIHGTHFVGHYDAIVKYEDGLHLYEFKNVHSKKILYQDVNEEYILQGLTYIYALSNKDIIDLRVCLISRDDWIIKESAYSLTTEYKNKIENEISEMEKYLKLADLPNELQKGDKRLWMCEYCQYIRHCSGAKERINGDKR